MSGNDGSSARATKEQPQGPTETAGDAATDFDGVLENRALRAELERHLGPVFYSDLAAHLRRDAVFLVAPTLDLLRCGVALAHNATTLVSQWLESSQLRRPTSDEAARWAQHPERTFTALVVQPFVLVQESD